MKCQLGTREGRNEEEHVRQEGQQSQQKEGLVLEVAGRSVSLENRVKGMEGHVIRLERC